MPVSYHELKKNVHRKYGLKQHYNIWGGQERLAKHEK